MRKVLLCAPFAVTTHHYFYFYKIAFSFKLFDKNHRCIFFGTGTGTVSHYFLINKRSELLIIPLTIALKDHRAGTGTLIRPEKRSNC